MSETDRPFFRTDLVSRPIESAGHRFIEVTDPDSGHSFRFYEIEYAIACAMDGERDLPGLADWAKVELGVDPSPDELRTVISTLGDLGYLDTGELSEEVSVEPAPLDRPPPAGAPPSPFDLPRRLPPDLSTDLSEHLPVRADDVKEAVRQSRAMPVSRPPIEARDEFGDDDAFDDEKTPSSSRPPVRAPAAAAAAAGSDGGREGSQPSIQAALSKTLLGTPGPTPITPPLAPSPIAPIGRPELRPEARSLTPPPVVLPDMPAEISRQEIASIGSPSPAAPLVRAPAPGMPVAAGRQPVPAREAPARPVLPARRSGGFIPYLIVLLLLSVAGGGVYWWFFLREQGSEAGSTSGSPPPAAPSTVEATQPVPPPVEEPPPAPAEITATLEAGPTEEQEVRSPRPGQVVWLAASGSEVSEGAPVAKFEGYQRWDYAVKEAQESQRRYQEKLDQATAKGDKDAMKEAEANVKRKQGDIDRNTTELDKFLVKAPAGGVVEPSIKQRAQIKKDDPVAKILAQSEPRATFSLPPGVSPPGGEARVVARSDAGLAATCKVVSVEQGKLVVSCPTDSGLASGAEVVLKMN